MVYVIPDAERAEDDRGYTGPRPGFGRKAVSPRAFQKDPIQPGTSGCVQPPRSTWSWATVQAGGPEAGIGGSPSADGAAMHPKLPGNFRRRDAFTEKGNGLEPFMLKHDWCSLSPHRAPLLGSTEGGLTLADTRLSSGLRARSNRCTVCWKPKGSESASYSSTERTRIGQWHTPLAAQGEAPMSEGRFPLCSAATFPLGLGKSRSQSGPRGLAQLDPTRRFGERFQHRSHSGLRDRGTGRGMSCLEQAYSTECPGRSSVRVRESARAAFVSRLQ
jgi:hypothetical protein